VDRRFSLGFVLLVLIAGAIYLWLKPEQQGSPSPSPAPTPIAPAPASSLEPEPSTPTAPSHPGFYVLAATWMPGFCTLKPHVPECRGDVGLRFTLHGLWPGGEYCNIPSDVVATDEVNHWNDLPAVRLSDATWTALRGAMPGTKSHLERHEWVAHGSCAGVSQEVFFANAARLLRELSDSTVGDLFADSAGKRLTRAQIGAAFEQAFGSGAGKRVRISCEDDRSTSFIDELTIALYGDPFAGDGLGKMITAAHTRGGGCDGGMVER
jgi:ribonuclease T2